MRKSSLAHSQVYCNRVEKSRTIRLEIKERALPGFHSLDEVIHGLLLVVVPQILTEVFPHEYIVALV